MRKEYHFTEEQYDMIVEASKPVPYMVIGGDGFVEPRSTQENANEAWKILGKELGFNWKTARASSKGRMFFTAEPLE